MKISNCKRVPSIPSRYSQELQDLVDEILVTDPKKRPTVNQILKRDLLKERVKNYLNRIDFEEEFSHTILHNQYLFDKRKNRGAKLNPIPESPAKFAVASPAPVPMPSPAPVAPAKEPDWVKQSPRAAMGGGFKMNKNSSIKKKDQDSRFGARPASAKYAKPKSNKSSNPLAVQGEEIRPVISRLDGRRKVSELLDTPQCRPPQSKETPMKKEFDQKESDRSHKVNEKVKNIYNLKKDSKVEEQKKYSECKENIQHYTPIQASKAPVWMKASEDKVEEVKEECPFPDDPVIKANEK